MPYAVIEPSGCGIHKNRGKLRLDFFLNPDDPNYDKHHVYVVDETGEGYQKGYPGKLDDEGNPLDPEDYQKWLDSLPHIWRDNPFHSHFIYPDKGTTDVKLKAKIESCLSYFYQFHQHCWDESKGFIEEWKKVPSQVGQVRCPFIKGDSKDLIANQDKVQGILSRVQNFQLSISKIPPQDLNIGEKGTIDVGSPAINRGTNVELRDMYGNPSTYVEAANPANADGIIDTVEVCMFHAIGGNSIKFGTFKDLGSNVLKCHDAEEYGEVPVGFHVCTGLSIDIFTGEYTGADARGAIVVLRLEADDAGGVGIWEREGQYCDLNDQATFTWKANWILSLYGTGTEAAVGWTGKISGVSNPAKVMGVPVANIAKVKGVA